jgi:hypothetical protein
MFLQLEALGAPDVEFGGLCIWVHGRPYPDATEYWDANWLRVTASYSSAHSRVVIGGPILHLAEISDLIDGARELHATLSGEAALRCIDANLQMTLTSQARGEIAVHIEMTPDHGSESHVFEQVLDQSYLPALIRACEGVLERYPIKAEP